VPSASTRSKTALTPDPTPPWDPNPARAPTPTRTPAPPAPTGTPAPAAATEARVPEAKAAPTEARTPEAKAAPTEARTPDAKAATMEAATMEAATMEAATLEASAAALSVAEIGRGHKNGENDGDDDREIACHRRSFLQAADGAQSETWLAWSIHRQADSKSRATPRCDPAWTELGPLRTNIIVPHALDPTKWRPANTCHGVAPFVAPRQDRVVSSLEIMEVDVQVYKTFG
jgi:hypothetical protein